MLVFSVLRGWSDVYVGPKQSLHTQFLWGATPAMTGGGAMGEGQQQKSDDNINI